MLSIEVKREFKIHLQLFPGEQMLTFVSLALMQNCQYVFASLLTRQVH